MILMLQLHHKKTRKDKNWLCNDSFYWWLLRQSIDIHGIWGNGSFILSSNLWFMQNRFPNMVSIALFWSPRQKVWLLQHYLKEFRGAWIPKSSLVQPNSTAITPSLFQDITRPFSDGFVTASESVVVQTVHGTNIGITCYFPIYLSTLQILKIINKK